MVKWTYFYFIAIWSRLLESVIDEVSEALPKNFPAAISKAIFEGMRKVLKKAS